MRTEAKTDFWFYVFKQAFFHQEGGSTHQQAKHVALCSPFEKNRRSREEAGHHTTNIFIQSNAKSFVQQPHSRLEESLACCLFLVVGFTYDLLGVLAAFTSPAIPRDRLEITATRGYMGSPGMVCSSYYAGEPKQNKQHVYTRQWHRVDGFTHGKTTLYLLAVSSVEPRAFAHLQCLWASPSHCLLRL